MKMDGKKPHDSKMVKGVTGRKSDHIRISLEEPVETGGNGFDDIVLVHCAAPELDFGRIDPSVRFLGKKMEAPILIEAMTGGTEESMRINEALSNVAGKMGVGIEVGSQRAAIEDKNAEKTFSVIKKGAKNCLRIANLGAVQLNYRIGVEECQRAIDMIDADALALHFNPLQEVIQPEGNSNFAGLIKKVKSVCKGLSVPVIAKEVGCGISHGVAERLLDAGVEVIDVGGYGGTSWNLIEGYRADEETKAVSETFIGWGIPTAASLLEIRDLQCQKIASGGLRSGVDIAKAIALGADIGGIALPLLKAFNEKGESGVEAYLNRLITELKVAMFLTGAESVEALKEREVRILGDMCAWASQIR